MRKATDVLEKAFGAGQASASVDVTLSLDKTQITTEDLISPPSRIGQVPTGIVIRERENSRDASGSPSSIDARQQEGTSTRASNVQRDVEYAVGRRVEQIVGQPGAIRRLHAVAVIQRELSPAEIDQVSKLMAATVGLLSERGDSVVVHALPAVTRSMPESLTIDSVKLSQSLAQKPGDMSADLTGKAVPVPTLNKLNPVISYLLMLIALALLAVFLIWILRSRFARTVTPADLTDAQREQVLAQIQTWLQPKSGSAS